MARPIPPTISSQAAANPTPEQILHDARMQTDSIHQQLLTKISVVKHGLTTAASHKDTNDAVARLQNLETFITLEMNTLRDKLYFIGRGFTNQHIRRITAQEHTIAYLRQLFPKCFHQWPFSPQSCN